MISSKRTPKLKTSDFTENKPSIAYSGAMYPLLKIIKNITHRKNRRKKLQEKMLVLNSFFIYWGVIFLE
jgi:hypothetical protein